MFKKILFPIDLSKSMNRILPIVTEMADKFGSEIHCVHCLHVSTYLGDMGLGAVYVVDFELSLQQEIKMKLEDFISDNLKGRPVQSAILTGRPGDQLVEYAKEKQIDLVIMGHSTTGIERAIMGSVAGHVVKYSPVPVMVVSPGALYK